ncbi:MAG: hypothetical protein RUDDFDWM_001424 [Candidatus Fervidibacterota bacterium]
MSHLSHADESLNGGRHQSDSADVVAMGIPWGSTRVALPAYVCTFVVAFSALFASALTIGDPFFGSAALTLATIGLLSNYVRSVKITTLPDGIGQAISLLLVVFIPLYGLIIEPHRFFPPVVFELRDLHPLALMTWVCVITLTVTGRWGYDYAPLSFVLLPSLSMVSLSALHNINIEVTVAAIFIVSLGTFLLAYETTVMRAVKLRDERMLCAKDFLSLHVVSSAQWSLAVMLTSILLTPLLLYIRMPIAPPNVRLPAPRRFFMLSPEFTTFSRHMTLWGGPIKLSPKKLFEIEGDFYPYWRAQIYDEYTGHGWGSNEESKQVEQLSDGSFVFDFELPPHPKIVRAKVRILEPSPTALLTPGLPLKLVSNAYLQELRVSQDGILRTYRTSVIVNSYEIVAAVNEPSVEMLMNANETFDSVGEQVPPKYLQLPTSVERVAQLAKEIAAGSKTPYETAMRFVNYLQKHCRYSLTPPHVPLDVDAVDYFLFWTREGACDFFASALAVMCRAVGIPSRVLAGFMSDEYDQSTRTLTLREQDAHVWVEIYIPKHGWVIVDPTPPGRMRRGFFDFVSWWRNVRSRIKWSVMERFFGWFIGLLALISIIPMLKFWVRSIYMRISFSKGKLSEHLQRSYLSLLNELNRIGVCCEHFHTPLEIASMLDSHSVEHLKEVFSNASALLRRLSFIAYSPLHFDKENILNLEADIRRLVRSLRWHRFLWLFRRLQKLLLAPRNP